MEKRKNYIKGDGNTTVNGDLNQPILSPTVYIFNPQVMADIIDALYIDKKNTQEETLTDFFRPDIDKKNEINAIDQDFFDQCIKECYIYFRNIDKFFKAPENKIYKDKYESILIEIRGKILIELKRGKKLQEILPSLLDYAKEKLPNFGGENAFWLNIFAYYMYANCDIGEKYVKTK